MSQPLQKGEKETQAEFDARVLRRIEQLHSNVIPSRFLRVIEIHEIQELAAYYRMGYSQAYFEYECDWILAAAANIAEARKKKAAAEATKAAKALKTTAKKSSPKATSKRAAAKTPRKATSAKKRTSAAS